MNFKKILFVAGLAVASCFAANAQQEVETDYVFNPHWYVQGQFGAQHTLGEIDFKDLLSPNAQVTVGYNWTAIWGARLAVNMWQSKGGVKMENLYNKYEKYKWNYVAPTVDLTMNLSNAIAGFNPNRKVDVSIFAGIGANFAFSNDEALDVKNQIDAMDKTTVKDKANIMQYYWDGNRTSLVAQFGAMVDFKLTDRVSLGLEFGANTLSDHYNSKKAKNADWYFNALAGVKVNLGNTYTKRTRTVAPCEPQIVEKIVEKEVIKEVVKEPAKEGPIRRDLFFEIRGSEVSPSEMAKLEEVVSYLYRHPEAKVTVTGYADKGTGNTRINQRYSEARAKKVVKLLTERFSISESRIISAAKGDTEQPYSENNLNRVTICIAE